MIDLIVPVLSRPSRAQPLVDNIHEATSSPHRILFICSEGDEEEIQAVAQTGEAFLIHKEPADRANFARKTNWGYRETSGEWLFLGADDLVFSRGWDTAALACAARTHASVIGTQDLGNPLVKKGHAATHCLVRRSYIQEQGGTFDGSGEIFSEVYDHQAVDLELVHAAKARGVWAFAGNSVVEHRHPLWKKGEWDPVYEKAFREAREDLRLFRRRLNAFEGRSRRRK